MTPKLYKAAEVCDIAQVQPYVLRSWEKEFPGIGVQKSPDAVRFYRQADVDQVLRIKQLVFGEGLTLAGARRRLEDQLPSPPPLDEEDAAEEPEARPATSPMVTVLRGDARATIDTVREGLRQLLEALSQKPGTGEMRGDRTIAADEEYALVPPAAGAAPAAKRRPIVARSTARVTAKASASSSRPAPKRAAGKGKRARA